MKAKARIWLDCFMCATFARRIGVQGTPRPLSGECSTHKTVKAGFWPWLSCKSPQHLLDCSLFARTRPGCWTLLLFFFFTLVTGPRRSLSLKLSGARVYEPQIRARLGTTAHFCKVLDPETVAEAAATASRYRGTSLIRKAPPP